MDVALGLGLILVTGASAQCGLPKKPVKPAAWHPSGKIGLLYVRANDDEEHGDVYRRHVASRYLLVRR